MPGKDATMTDDDTHLVIARDKLAEIIATAAEHDHAGYLLNAIEQASMTTTLQDDTVIPPVVNVLGELAHQVSRIAGALDRPTPTITEESAVAAWQKHLRVYEDKAVPFLEELGIRVEKEPTRRI